MTREEYQAAVDNMIYLVSCAVKETIPDRERVESMLLTNLYTVADYHLLTSAVAFALESAGIFDPSFAQAKAKAIRKIALMDAEMAEIFSKMEEAGIWYMPLKGTVLKDYYPQFGMREMADHDILFDASRADDVKDIMIGMGYDVEHFGTSNHDCYFKEPVCNFEMHRALFGAGYDQTFQEYYHNIENRLVGDGYEKHFTPEDFYIYMIAHEYKHYSIGGTGLRSLLDAYVYLQKVKLNMAYVTVETERLGIAEFETSNHSLAQHLFSGEELTETEREMLKYILSSGTYGTFLHRVENKMRKNQWGKIRYALSRFFVPMSKKNEEYNTLSSAYPVFYKYKILLPLLPFYRVLRGLKSGKLLAELKALKNAKG